MVSTELSPVGVRPAYPPISTGRTELTGEPKPVAGFILSLLGGVFILAGGLLVLLLFLAVTPSAGTFLGVSSVFLPLLGLVTGPAIIALAVLFYRRPEHPGVYGGFILGLSVISYASFLGGLFVGLLLGVIGGILVLLWRPPSHHLAYYPALAPYPSYRTCPRCGRGIVADSQFCSYCGIALG